MRATNTASLDNLTQNQSTFYTWANPTTKKKRIVWSLSFGSNRKFHYFIWDQLQHLAIPKINIAISVIKIFCNFEKTRIKPICTAISRAAEAGHIDPGTQLGASHPYALIPRRVSDPSFLRAPSFNLADFYRGIENPLAIRKDKETEEGKSAQKLAVNSTPLAITFLSICWKYRF